MDQEDRDDVKDILEKLDRDIELPPYNNRQNSTYSKTYKQYQREERHSQRLNRYEKFCQKSASLLQLSAGKSTHDKLTHPIKLLTWNITPGMVLSASVITGFIAFILFFILFVINAIAGFFIPMPIMLGLMLLVFGSAYYTYQYPILEAKNKVIESSGQMILAILYMVVFLRKTPNLEGAVRFAATNLQGPIAKDLKMILWKIEIGEENNIDEALENYTKRWKKYNDDFLESLSIIISSMNEPNPGRRQEMLENSIETILDGTKEDMKHYAQSLKTPVMILNAMGAMLPVLGMIMLPLVSVFMGGAITPLHLVILFNISLPIFLWWFMQRVLSARPPTVSSEPTDESILPKRGRYPFNVFGNEIELPVWPIGAVVGLVIAIFGIIGYISFPAFYPVEDFDPSMAPGVFMSDGEMSPFPMLMRSILIVLGLGIAVGLTLFLGNTKRKKKEKQIEEIESQFPTALFTLGNKISGGTPIEVALQKAAESTSDMEISELFQTASGNVQRMGMTFEEALFDEKHGALKQFPSKMIETVMRAVLRSSEKGTKMASTAMITISDYLDNIHKTQEQLNDLMEETKTTIQMLAYMLAPVVSGVAVGMSQTIISAMFQLTESFEGAQDDLRADDAPGGEEAGAEAGAGGGMEMGGILGNMDTAIPPELLQFVVGIYLIQLIYILGTFYTKITKGNDETYRNLLVGKILISAIIIYSLVVIVVSLMFGGIVSEI